MSVDGAAGSGPTVQPVVQGDHAPSRKTVLRTAAVASRVTTWMEPSRATTAAGASWSSPPTLPHADQDGAAAGLLRVQRRLSVPRTNAYRTPSAPPEASAGADQV